MKKTKKSKVLELDGQVFTIAPLKMGQIEEFIESGSGSQTTWDTILASLSNAGETLTMAELKNKIDLEDFLTLHGEVLAISGLKTSGEAKAATDSRLPTSAAA